MSTKKNQDFIDAFGKNLKMIRKSKGISQEKLAELSGLALSQIGRAERGKTNSSLDIIKTIADALEIDVAELFKF